MVEFKAERVDKSYTMTLGAPPVDVLSPVVPGAGIRVDRALVL